MGARHAPAHLLVADLVTLPYWKWSGNPLTAFIAFLCYSVLEVLSYWGTEPAKRMNWSRHFLDLSLIYKSQSAATLHLLLGRGFRVQIVSLKKSVDIFPQCVSTYLWGVSQTCSSSSRNGIKRGQKGHPLALFLPTSIHLSLPDCSLKSSVFCLNLNLLHSLPFYYCLLARSYARSLSIFRHFFIFYPSLAILSLFLPPPLPFPLHSISYPCWWISLRGVTQVCF